MREVIDNAIDMLTKYSVPLYVNDQYERPEQFGTGFFVRADQPLARGQCKRSLPGAVVLAYRWLGCSAPYCPRRPPPA